MIVAHFRALVDAGWQVQPMLQLASQIAQSKYASGGLYGTTSMAELLVATTPELSYDQDVLRIKHDSGKLLFEFVDAPVVEQRWKQSYEPAEGFTAFEDFVAGRQWCPS